MWGGGALSPNPLGEAVLKIFVMGTLKVPQFKKHRGSATCGSVHPTFSCTLKNVEGTHPRIKANMNLVRGIN